MADKIDELAKLESISENSLYAANCYDKTLEYCFKIFKRHFLGDSLLELGPAEGLMTDLLVSSGMAITVVEGSSKFCSEISQRHPNIEVVHSLFESYEPNVHFDNIILGHVLEHVDDPVELLKRVKRWANSGGVIIAAVPNSRSLHRQAGVEMGLLGFEEELNDLDVHHGHRRVYNSETFRRDFREAGLRIAVFGGYFLKPVTGSQIESSWTPEMLNAFMRLGERYPDIAGELYIVASV